MLKLIVLGYVPGTDIQLTFTQIGLAAIGFYMTLLFIHELRQLSKRPRTYKTRQKQIA